MIPPAVSAYAALREEYTLATLDEASVYAHPVVQFETWFDEALRAGVPDVNAMTLATCGRNGQPHARTVLLKGVEENAFVFFTNYQSHKGQQLLENPLASLLFFWKELQRQVRIEGRISPISHEASEQYFQSRPRESQLGAWASQQSESLASRATLEQALQSLQEQYEGQDIPCPPHWGGYALQPVSMEFWQGRMSRLHDRILYTSASEGWQIERLYP